MGSVKLWDTRASIPLGNSDIHDGKAFCVNWAHPSENGKKMNVTSNGDTDVKAPAVGNSLFSGGSDCYVRKHELCA
jgi:hypothetical protein